MIEAFVVMTVSCECCLAARVVEKTHPIFVGDECWPWRDGNCARLAPCLMVQVDESHDTPDAARIDDDARLDHSSHDNSSGSCCPSSRLRSNFRPSAVLRNMNMNKVTPSYRDCLNNGIPQARDSGMPYQSTYEFGQTLAIRAETRR